MRKHRKHERLNQLIVSTVFLLEGKGPLGEPAGQVFGFPFQLCTTCLTHKSQLLGSQDMPWTLSTVASSGQCSSQKVPSSGQLGGS